MGKVCAWADEHVCDLSRLYRKFEFWSYRTVHVPKTVRR